MKQFEYGGNPVSKTFESLINGVNDLLINENNDKEWIKEHDKRMADYEKEIEYPHDCSTCKYRRIDDISCETCGSNYANWVSEAERDTNVLFPCINEINCTCYNEFVHCGVRWNHIGVGIGADMFFDNAKWTGELRNGGRGWIVKPSKNNPMIK